jgi:hypothetical protein
VTTFWIIMYCLLFVFNGFCALLAWQGFRPFRRRWQLIIWHACLILRLAWLGALLVGIWVMVGWVRQGFRENNNGGGK